MSTEPHFLENLIPDNYLNVYLKDIKQLKHYYDLTPNEILDKGTLSDFDKSIIACFTQSCGYNLLNVSRSLLKNGSFLFKLTGIYSFMKEQRLPNEPDEAYAERLVFYYYIYLYNAILKSPKSLLPFKTYRGANQINKLPHDQVFYLSDFLHTSNDYQVAFGYSTQDIIDNLYLINYHIHPLANYSSIKDYLTTFTDESEIIIASYNRICYISHKVLTLDDLITIKQTNVIDSYWGYKLENFIKESKLIEYNYLVLPNDQPMPKSIKNLKEDMTDTYSRKIKPSEMQMVEMFNF